MLSWFDVHSVKRGGDVAQNEEAGNAYANSQVQ